MSLSILLRNCDHNANATSTTLIRYALQVEDFSVSYARTPIQLPLMGASPELIDLGVTRPSISISGIIETVGPATTTTAGYENMSSINVTRKYWNGSSYTDATCTYYIPYKNVLERAINVWTFDEGSPLQLEVGDANFPEYNTSAVKNSSGSNAPSGTNSETGGALYKVAIQQGRFSLSPGREDRYEFQMQFVCESRADIKFEEVA